jgi:integrase
MAGTTDDFFPSKLVLIPSRPPNYYVRVTIPEKFRKSPKAKQVRVSTGTADLKKAQKLQHGITAKIYASFENPLKEELEHMASLIVGADMRGTISKADVDDKLRLRETIRWLQKEIDSLRRLPVDPEDNDVEHSLAIRAAYTDYEPRLKALAADTYTTPQAVEGITIGDVIPDYLAARTWNRLKTKSEAEKSIKRFVAIVGDIPLKELTKYHAWQYAEALAAEGKATKTITTALSYVTKMLKWCEKKPHLGLPSQPFNNLDLRDYGVKTVGWKNFTKEQLMQLFALPMKDQDRLLFSILITTGMRLDEAALLTWEKIKVEDGITIFDIRDSVVKNEPSMRMIPIPAWVKMPERGTGRLFTYRLDKDGKAQNAAPRIVNRYIDKVTLDPKVVAHSLRGNLKDLLRDAGVSEELNHFITGHTQSNAVAGGYGGGHSMSVRLEALNKAQHPWLVAKAT